MDVLVDGNKITVISGDYCFSTHFKNRYMAEKIADFLKMLIENRQKAMPICDYLKDAIRFISQK